MGTKKIKIKKERIQDQNKNPNTISFIFTTKTGQFLRICSSPPRECEGG
jgi:hypothetical protein